MDERNDKHDLVVVKSKEGVEAYMWNDCFGWFKAHSFEGEYEGITMGKDYLILYTLEGF